MKIKQTTKHDDTVRMFNSLAPRDCDFDFKELIFKCIVVITFISISSATDFGWMVQDSTDDK